MKEYSNPNFMDEIENKLKDRSSDYLVICIHDDKVYYRYSSKVSSYGMAALILENITDEWHTEGIEDMEDGAL